MSRELPIIAVRTDHKHRKQWERRYGSTRSALARASDILLEDGSPGDTITLYHAVTSKYLGFLRIHAKGRFSGERIWDKPEKVSPEVLASLNDLLASLEDKAA